jgi:2-phospho-L-lactate guanylyltransferase
MSVYILIPCKSLGQGKSRLARVLSRKERRRLCGLLLRRTLSLALAVQRSERVLVITSDLEATAIAEAYGVGALQETESGLNEALRTGRADILRRNEVDTSALILPIDLVEATPGAVGRVIRPDMDLVLASDEKGRGTNVLYIGTRALAEFCFAFGPDSFLAHRNWAEIEGFRVQVIEDPLLALDLDDPADLARWQGGSAAALTLRAYGR